jgi:hypothetical protein
MRDLINKGQKRGGANTVPHKTGHKSGASQSARSTLTLALTSLAGLGLAGLASGTAHAQVVNPAPKLIQFGTLQAIGSNGSASNYRGQFVDRGNNTAVRDRPRGPLEPVNIRLGAFTLSPSVDYDTFQTDNATRAGSNGKSDTAYIIRPRMTVASNWSRHAIGFGIGVAGTVYQDFSTEDTTDFEFQASGRLDVQRGSNLQAAYRYFDGSEGRGLAGLPNTVAEPSTFRQNGLTVGGVWELSRTRLSANIDVSQDDYDPLVLIDGSRVTQEDRNNSGYALTLRGDFALTPKTAIFGSFARGTRDYKSLGNIALPSRDSAATEALVGVNFDISDFYRGEASIGYSDKSFDSDLYDNATAFVYRGAVEWFPTRVVTIGAVATRNITESVVLGSGSAITTGYGLQADWDVRSNLVLSARAQRDISKFDQALGRQDERTTLNVSAVFLLTQWLSLVFNITNDQLTTNDPTGLNFDETRAGVRVTVRK